MKSFIEAIQKLLPWIAGLPLAPKIIFSIIIILLVVFILIVIWTPPSQFTVNFITIVRLKWPCSLLLIYPSALGKTMSPVSIALYLEVVNNRPTISRIFSYNCRALLKYDEGGVPHIVSAPEGGIKYIYKPSGNVVEKWRMLHSMGFLGDQVYFVTSDGYKRCRRLDFSQNSFDNLARNTQLLPGESIMGWIFFELEHDLRGQLPEIKELELTIRNSAGETQAYRSRQEPKSQEDIGSFISGGDWHILPKDYDLTKEHYYMVPMVDLPRVLKEGSLFIRGKEDKVESDTVE